MRRLLAAFLGFALVSGLFTGALPASSTVISLAEGTDTQAAFFDPLKVSTVNLSKASDGPDLTWDNLNTTDYQRANISITTADGATTNLNEIGVRLKGQASRGAAKMPLKIKFDAFVTGQKFMGLKRMTLNNMVQDPTMIHESTVYRLYRAAGIPAPRTSYAKVFIDGNYYGLYLNIESIDKEFAQRWFPSTQHIYSGPYNCDVVVGVSGCYEAGIGDPLVRTDLNHAASYSNLHGLAWWTAINTVADMPTIIKLMATDVLIANWDGYTDAVQNNHSVHFDDTGVLTIIPWGMDQSLSDPYGSIGSIDRYMTWDGNGPLFRGWGNHRSTMFDHCIEYAPCKTKFIQAGIYVSGLINSINLFGYESQMASVVNNSNYIDGDLSGNNISNMQANQAQINPFIRHRQSVLTTYLYNNSLLPFTLSPTPRISGTTRVTYTLTATAGTWDFGTTTTYQWFRSGVKITGATKRTYRLVSLDRGKRITVRVTGTKAHYAPVTKASAATAAIR